jgi:hypothetical protein
MSEQEKIAEVNPNLANTFLASVEGWHLLSAYSYLLFYVIR